MLNTASDETDLRGHGGHHVLCSGMKHHPEDREAVRAELREDRGRRAETVEEGARSVVDVDHGNPFGKKERIQSRRRTAVNACTPSSQRGLADGG